MIGTIMDTLTIGLVWDVAVENGAMSRVHGHAKHVQDTTTTELIGPPGIRFRLAPGCTFLMAPGFLIRTPPLMSMKAIMGKASAREGDAIGRGIPTRIPARAGEMKNKPKAKPQLMIQAFLSQNMVQRGRGLFGVLQLLQLIETCRRALLTAQATILKSD